MSYSTNPVRDAETYFDRQFAEGERVDADIAFAAETIREAFAAFQPIPFVSSTGSKGVLRYMPWTEAVNDYITYPETDALLMDVLKNSECPKVKALMKAIVDRYVDMNADELGML